jgi:hypothetical protein
LQPPPPRRQNAAKKTASTSASTAPLPAFLVGVGTKTPSPRQACRHEKPGRDGTGGRLR